MDRNYLDSIRRLWQNDNPFSNRRHEREWPGFANRQRTRNSSPFLNNSREFTIYYWNTIATCINIKKIFYIWHLL